jgi:hypothetical protein
LAMETTPLDSKNGNAAQVCNSSKCDAESVSGRLRKSTR